MRKKILAIAIAIATVTVGTVEEVYAFDSQVDTQVEEAGVWNYQSSPEDWSPYYYYYWGEILTPSLGRVIGPSGEETFYNRPMEGVISIMQGEGFDAPYWVREDGVKMYGDYIMVAADLTLRPRGTILKTSLGLGIVCDTGEFIYSNPWQVDIAVCWQ